MQSHLTVRPAKEADFPLIASLMDEALAPYYGGDHRAHAERIFKTHISGGHDHIGHFSFEQRMFVAEYDRQFAGMIHVVGKRQHTYKISPLIVAPQFRSRHGVGQQLLQIAEDYARSRQARQLYCTVAENNYGAMQFFLRNGFIRAGRSDSHYKVGSTETMMYKLLSGVHYDASKEEDNISVIPLEERYKSQASSLILDTLPKTFGGIDESWVHALFDGYERRGSGDINTKYKLIYVAVNRRHEVLGIAGATPKKGQPIKLMPFLATNMQAFRALLTDLPYILKPYGHKLYLHIVPTVQETIILQRMGWQLAAVMPAAYHDDYVTQQWGYSLGSDLMRTMRVKPRFFNQILSGEKPLEVRVGYDNIKTIRPGEEMRLECHTGAALVKVEEVYAYDSFESMLEIEDPAQIVPGHDKGEVLRLLKEIYSPEKEGLGVIVLRLNPIRRLK